MGRVGPGDVLLCVLKKFLINNVWVSRRVQRERCKRGIVLRLFHSGIAPTTAVHPSHTPTRQSPHPALNRPQPPSTALPHTHRPPVKEAHVNPQKQRACSGSPLPCHIPPATSRQLPRDAPPDKLPAINPFLPHPPTSGIALTQFPTLPFPSPPSPIYHLPSPSLLISQPPHPPHPPHPPYLPLPLPWFHVTAQKLFFKANGWSSNAWKAWVWNARQHRPSLFVAKSMPSTHLRFSVIPHLLPSVPNHNNNLTIIPTTSLTHAHIRKTIPHLPALTPYPH
ncbi:unnamed protein product [Chondrus crispus]|uniref:Uncharacterized protein n=1 Tax=Chondrus crispus TaxID=2769 RepID=R7QRA1_CHOCR|nr:unnamed protein product [Chondrus crispus]CDF39986.1 unnamed protein product [Chondrus crispus]|eukprot:XP_005710280.1 unnamed protein product [Chondrus crispus]